MVFTLKCFHELFGKRFEEFPGDDKLALSKAKRPFLDATWLQRANLSDRLIAFAENNCFTLPDHGKVTGEIGLCLMNIQSNHAYNINQVVNQVNSLLKLY